MFDNHELIVSIRSPLIKIRRDYALLCSEIPYSWYLPTVEEGLKKKMKIKNEGCC